MFRESNKQPLMSELKEIEIKGARVHNLKNVDLSFPKNKLVVFTGLSGSGKSSLAFDTLYAEGQRRYVESLSSYARQFLGIMDKPDVDSITGLSPAISIDQKSSGHSPRSTVGTVTEIYDYLRLLYAKIGRQHCPICGNAVYSQTLHEIREAVLKLGAKAEKKVYILAPLVKRRKGTYLDLFANFKKNGFVRVRVDGSIYNLDEEIKLDKNLKHTIELVVDRLVIKPKVEDAIELENLRKRVLDSLETASNQSGGEVIVAEEDDKEKWTEHFFSEENYCPIDDIYLPEIVPSSFSFNSPQGACEKCNGIGFIREIDKDILYNPRLTIMEGGIFPWSGKTEDTWRIRIMQTIAEEEGFDLNTPLGKYPPEVLNLILYGSGSKKYRVEYQTQAGHVNTYNTKFEGVIPNLERRYKETNSDYMRNEIEKYMRDIDCPECHGKRLKSFALAVKVADMPIDDLVNKSIDDSLVWSEEILANKTNAITEQNFEVARPILKEVKARLTFLASVGLGYLTIARSARTLSGGESQRIRLASQIGTGLTGVLYVLDEPSIGLHQRDNMRLITTLKGLRDLGNSVIVVEHDEETMLESDWIVDIGPGAGAHGGEIIFNGQVKELMKSKTPTAKYLSREEIVGREFLKNKRKAQASDTKLVIHKAKENNLKDIDVEIPLNKFVAVTGISGSGKSTLINDILYKNLVNELQHGRQIPGKSEGLSGVENIDKVVNIDQSPIGRTPRSNPATYTGIFTYIRNLFADLPESKARGYGPGRFSFNVKNGRCENCEGDGVIKIEMQFLADVYVECEVCHGKRYNEDVLQVDFKGKNIADVLDMRVEEALAFFDAIPIVKRKLETLDRVGLSYVKLGQPATQLSGGEAQRVKLATELSKMTRGNALYILDEPTTGLHFQDIDKLLVVLHALVEKGNSVVVIEHNLDVIKTADWIIDMGPEGGDAGGQVIFEGAVDEIIKDKDSWTGRYLKQVVERDLKHL
jgi:excinuclease ABC subunit A